MESASYVPAFLGLISVAVGGLTSFTSSWFTQRWQFREKRVEAIRSDPCLSDATLMRMRP